LLQRVPKIALFILLAVAITGCNAVKRVPDGEFLLTKNHILVNGEEENSSRINDIPYLEPNTRLPVLNLPIRLYVHNWARPNIDSILNARFIENESRRKFLTFLLSRKQLNNYLEYRRDLNRVIKNTGEAPAIIKSDLAQRSADRLSEYYQSNGWFNASTTYEIDRDSTAKKGEVTYKVNTGEAYTIDSLKTFIRSPKVDSIYNKYKAQSTLLAGNQYKLLDVNAETTRLTSLFRNQGVFYFDRDYISFIGDSVQTGHKVNLELYIKNREIEVSDTLYEESLKVHHISKINVYTDYSYAARNEAMRDSASLNNYNIYAFDKINYKPKYLTDAIFIEPGDLYSDNARNKSLIRLSQLRTFRYPDLRFSEDPTDPEGTDLIANFYLTPLPRFNLSANFDVSTSNIQKFGIGGSGSLLVRNLFGGLETLQISGRGSIGDSYDAGNNNPFFDITELGADVSLTIPRIFFPISTRSFILPEMSPQTSFNVGFGTQQNIGLDKQQITGGINYRWSPSGNLNFRFDLFDIQYIRNLNIDNYYEVYRNSFENLNTIAVDNLDASSPYLEMNDDGTRQLTIPDGTAGFTSDVQNGAVTLGQDDFDQVRSIEERRQRLTADNLILASSFTYYKNTRSGLFDNEFTSFRAKLEIAGNTLDLLSDIANLDKDQNGNSRILGVTYSQYVKPEIEFIKHWDLGNENILALRIFGGIAIPYGNSNSIPFIRSYFAGGSNDNRAWQAYRLGPGRTNSPNDFNEANLKLAFNVEQRFQLFGDLKGALFADVGNIWNALDNVEDQDARFNGFDSLRDIAVGSGFGLRYDFSFFVLRFDVGFKTYNPALPRGDRWFKQYNFRKAVFNVGINYPF